MKKTLYKRLVAYQKQQNFYNSQKIIHAIHQGIKNLSRTFQVVPGALFSLNLRLQDLYLQVLIVLI